MQIDDIEDFGKKSNKIRGDIKGKSFERYMAKVLSKRFGQTFSRTIGSGNRFGQVAHLPIHAKQTFAGDLVVPENFAFVFEIKRGYDDIDLNGFFGGLSSLDKFIKQAELESKNCDRKPVLIWKKDRKPPLVFINKNNYKFEHNYMMFYRDWKIILLDDFLSNEDSFFFK